MPRRNRTTDKLRTTVSADTAALVEAVKDLEAASEAVDGVNFDGGGAPSSNVYDPFKAKPADDLEFRKIEGSGLVTLTNVTAGGEDYYVLDVPEASGAGGLAVINNATTNEFRGMDTDQFEESGGVISIKDGAEIAGDLKVTNLFVSGTTTQVNTTETSIEDPTIVLNSATGSGSSNGPGILMLVKTKGSPVAVTALLGGLRIGIKKNKTGWAGDDYFRISGCSIEANNAIYKATSIAAGVNVKIVTAAPSNGFYRNAVDPVVDFTGMFAQRVYMKRIYVDSGDDWAASKTVFSTVSEEDYAKLALQGDAFDAGVNSVSAETLNVGTSDELTVDASGNLDTDGRLYAGGATLPGYDINASNNFVVDSSGNIIANNFTTAATVKAGVVRANGQVRITDVGDGDDDNRVLLDAIANAGHVVVYDDAATPVPAITLSGIDGSMTGTGKGQFGEIEAGSAQQFDVDVSGNVLTTGTIEGGAGTFASLDVAGGDASVSATGAIVSGQAGQAGRVTVAEAGAGDDRVVINGATGLVQVGGNSHTGFVQVGDGTNSASAVFLSGLQRRIGIRDAAGVEVFNLDGNTGTATIGTVGGQDGTVNLRRQSDGAATIQLTGGSGNVTTTGDVTGANLVASSGGLTLTGGLTTKVIDGTGAPVSLQAGMIDAGEITADKLDGSALDEHYVYAGTSTAAAEWKLLTDDNIAGVNASKLTWSLNQGIALTGTGAISTAAGSISSASGNMSTGGTVTGGLGLIATNGSLTLTGGDTDDLLDGSGAPVKLSDEMCVDNTIAVARLAAGGAPGTKVLLDSAAYGQVTDAHIAGVNGGKITWDGDEAISADSLVLGGDLTVNGTTTTIDSVDLQVTDRFIFQNAGYEATAPLGGGIIMVNNVVAATDTYDINTGGFASGGLTVNVAIDTDNSTPLVEDDVIQVSNAALAANNGIYVVDNLTAGVITIKAPGDPKYKDAFTEDTDDGDATIRHVAISCEGISSAGRSNSSIAAWSNNNPGGVVRDHVYLPASPDQANVFYGDGTVGKVDAATLDLGGTVDQVLLGTSVLGTVSNNALAGGIVASAKLSATGTKNATTVLRGDDEYAQVDDAMISGVNGGKITWDGDEAISAASLSIDGGDFNVDVTGAVTAAASITTTGAVTGASLSLTGGSSANLLDGTGTEVTKASIQDGGTPGNLTVDTAQLADNAVDGTKLNGTVTMDSALAISTTTTNAISTSAANADNTVETTGSGNVNIQTTGTGRVLVAQNADNTVGSLLISTGDTTSTKPATIRFEPGECTGGTTGGDFVVAGGVGSGTGNGGLFRLRAGNSTGAGGNGGEVEVRGGACSATAGGKVGGALNLYGGPGNSTGAAVGGKTTVRGGGVTAATAGTGGELEMYGGDTTGSTNSTGGAVIVRGGLGTGTGDGGDVLIRGGLTGSGDTGAVRVRDIGYLRSSRDVGVGSGEAHLDSAPAVYVASTTSGILGNSNHLCGQVGFADNGGGGASCTMDVRAMGSYVPSVTMTATDATGAARDVWAVVSGSSPFTITFNISNNNANMIFNYQIMWYLP